jgi:pimeloyl-ACP methyl ester carboxylesterase
MAGRTAIQTSALVLVIFGSAAVAGAASWDDPSPHKARFVTVAADVQLEVLDWGGSGTPVILLAGGGNTAHVFDEFAPKLAADCHVYGVTRRGFGESGFSAADGTLHRLRDDLLAVMDALEIRRAVLVGHSIAGAELSAVATARPDRIAGLVYLEAAYPYAFDNGTGPTMKDFQVAPPHAPRPNGADLASFAALQKWNAETNGVRTPEAELRHTWEVDNERRPTKARKSPGLETLMAVLSEVTRHTAIPVPALAVFALPHTPETWIAHSSDPAVKNAAVAYFATIDRLTEAQITSLQAGAPAVRIVRLKGAHHIFLSNASDVLREIRAFLTRL